MRVRIEMLGGQGAIGACIGLDKTAPFVGVPDAEDECIQRRCGAVGRGDEGTIITVGGVRVVGNIGSQTGGAVYSGAGHGWDAFCSYKA